MDQDKSLSPRFFEEAYPEPEPEVILADEIAYTTKDAVTSQLESRNGKVQVLWFASGVIPQ